MPGSLRKNRRRAQFSAATDRLGAYRLLGLPVGEYTLLINHMCFQSYRQSAIRLRIEDRITVDVQLPVGNMAQTVEVSAAASQLQTATGEVSYAVDEHKVVTLPLDGRNFIPLIALAPGVALPGGGSLLPRNQWQPAANE